MVKPTLNVLEACHRLALMKGRKRTNMRKRRMRKAEKVKIGWHSTSFSNDCLDCSC